MTVLGTSATGEGITGVSYTPGPSLDTTPITASGFTGTPACPAILTSAKGTDLNTFLANYGLKDAGTGAPAASIKDRLTAFQNGLSAANNQLQPISGLSGYADINTFLTSLGTSVLPVIRLANTCLRENLQVDTTAYEEAKAKAEESKLRLNSILTPEQHLSYYDGWFPLIRPMTESALFGIFGAALFMLIMSILIFLRMTGVQIQLQIPEMTGPSWFTLPPNASYYMYGGLAAGLIGTGIAYKFGYV